MQKRTDTKEEEDIETEDYEDHEYTQRELEVICQAEEDHRCGPRYDHPLEEVHHRPDLRIEDRHNQEGDGAASSSKGS